MTVCVHIGGGGVVNPSIPIKCVIWVYFLQTFIFMCVFNLFNCPVVCVVCFKDLIKFGFTYNFAFIVLNWCVATLKNVHVQLITSKYMYISKLLNPN